MAFSAYKIEGKVNMKGEWQNQIYLATIDKLDDYFSANAEFVINVAEIDKDGNFKFEGDILPDRFQFYRIYLLKEEHSEFNACLYEGGEEHNFIHIILNNHSQLKITADASTYAPFGDYLVEGDAQNHLMKKLTSMVYPSYLFYEIRFPSELKYSQDKLMKDLFVFSDTCSNALVSLAAINNTDYDRYFTYNTEAYESIGNQMKKEQPDHPYTRDFQRKLRYYADDGFSESNWLFKGLALLFGLSTFILGYLYVKLRKKKQGPKLEPVPNVDHSVKSLTPQELKILAHIQNGKSNKEIASELYIEVSTVKSHINKLYGKLKVKNRSEAIRAKETLGL